MNQGIFGWPHIEQKVSTINVATFASPFALTPEQTKECTSIIFTGTRTGPLNIVSPLAGSWTIINDTNQTINFLSLNNSLKFVAIASNSARIVTYDQTDIWFGPAQSKVVIFNPSSLGTVRLWLKSNGSGTTWIDNSGNANNGTLSGGASWGSGVVNFDGIDDRVDTFASSISPRIGTTGVTARVVCVWATNTDPAYTRRGLIGTRNVNDGFFFGYASSTGYFYGLAGSTNWTPTATIPSYGTRNMYAFTHSGTTVAIYLNGIQIAVNTSFSGSEVSTTYNGRIGGEQQSDTTANWKGTIDQVLTYSTPLSASDIYTIYQNMS